jgi:hypothetical protein
MLLKDFYAALDQELNELLQKYKDDAAIQKHSKNIDSQKGYAFLIWFMETYGKIRDYPNFVTDGKGDHSFDIIFPIPDQIGKKIYYVVQSKWKKTAGVTWKQADGKNEFLRSLQELETVLRGTIPPDANAATRKNLEEFAQHRRENGEVKFIFLTLCINNLQAELQHNIDVFLQNNPLVKIEIIDIERLRLDYIDRHFKKIAPPNPLLSNYDPLKDKITLDVVRLHKGEGTFVRVDKPYTAYSFVLRPRTLYTLFQKYNFNLFHSNIRNPLLSSNINEDIVKTALEAPELFYYYNNGITALATSIPEINNQAEKIEVSGFQVINGAQTLYSIYTAYDKNPDFRTIMDEKILISLRLIEASNRALSLDITRYTNLQNPINERDFWSNDEVQIRLQKEFYDLGIIYEKRRGEFRDTPQNTKAISNVDFATPYALFILQEPYLVYQNYEQFEHTQKDWQFVSRDKNKNGLYELIFNKDTNAKNMIIAFDFFVIAYALSKQENQILIQVLLTTFVHNIALSFWVQKRYIELKYNTQFSHQQFLDKLQGMIISRKNVIFFAKTFYYAANFISSFRKNETAKKPEKQDVIFDEPTYYKILVHAFENSAFELSNIDDVEFDEDSIEILNNLQGFND